MFHVEQIRFTLVLFPSSPVTTGGDPNVRLGTSGWFRGNRKLPFDYSAACSPRARHVAPAVCGEPALKMNAWLDLSVPRGTLNVGLENWIPALRRNQPSGPHTTCLQHHSSSRHADG